jgi:hypothetical protein
MSRPPVLFYLRILRDLRFIRRAQDATRSDTRSCGEGEGQSPAGASRQRPAEAGTAFVYCTYPAATGRNFYENEEMDAKFPTGYETIKPYPRTTPQPNR